MIFPFYLLVHITYYRPVFKLKFAMIKCKSLPECKAIFLAGCRLQHGTVLSVKPMLPQYVSLNLQCINVMLTSIFAAKSARPFQSNTECVRLG